MATAKYVVMITNFRPPKSDFRKLQVEGITFFLIGNTGVASGYTSENLSVFQQHHFLPELTLETVLPVLKRYLADHDPAEFRLVTADEPVIYLVAQLRQMLHIPGALPEAILPFVNKTEMKKRLAKSTVAYPRYLQFDKAAWRRDTHYLTQVQQQLTFPLIAKPISQHGSIAISKITNGEQLTAWAEVASQDENEYELEEFVTGKLFECDALVLQGEVKYFACSEYTAPCMEFAHGRILGSLELREQDPQWALLKEFNDAVIQQLSPPDGVTHLEVFRTPEGRLVFLEIAVRAPGAMVCQMHEANAGINLETLHFRCQYDAPLNLQVNRKNAYQLWAYFPKFTGKIIQLHTPPVTSEYHIDWTVQVGETISASEHFASFQQIAGFLTLRNPDYAALKADFERLKSFKPITVEPVLEESGNIV